MCVASAAGRVPSRPPLHTDALCWRGVSEGGWALSRQPLQRLHNPQIRRFHFGLGALAFLFAPRLLVRRSNTTFSSVLFLSQLHLSRWAYLPVRSPTFFRKRFLFFVVVFWRGGGRDCCSCHTLEGWRRGKDLHGLAVEKIILQPPTCW